MGAVDQASAHEMSAQERQEWVQARSVAFATLSEADERRDKRKAAFAAMGKKPSAEKMGRALLAALAQGDSEMALELVEQGANPNLREQGMSAVDLALQKGAEEVAIALVAAGGFSGPERYSDESKRFTAAAAKGVFDEELAKSSGKRTMLAFEARAQSWKGVIAARDACAPSRPDTNMLQAMCLRWRFRQMGEALDAGVAMDGACWRAMCQGWAHRWSDPALLRDEPSVGALRAALGKPEAVASMPPEVAESLFVNAVTGADAPTLAALLDAGLRPSADWTMPLGHKETARASILVAAASSKSREAFDIVKALPAARRATAERPDTALALARAPIARLLELGELGVDLASQDEGGLGVAHYWARQDDKPRDGWASLASKAPAVFSMRDIHGKTGAQRMGEKLSGKARDDFLGSLSRIESREIRKEIGAPPKPSAATAPKRRL